MNGFIKDLLDWAFGTTAPDGSPAVGGSVSVDVGATGYSAAADTQAAVDRLTQLQREAMELYPAQGTTTFCNEGLWHVADALGCRDFDGMLAACIVTKAEQLALQPRGAWREVDDATAAAHALQGKLAFCGITAPPGEAHGHVATVAAMKMAVSPSWGTPEPYLANVGKGQNDFKLTSACFLAAERPMLRWFIWDPQV